MFTVENKEHSIVKFVMNNLTLEDLKRVLALITSLLETKKPFSFYVHTNFTELPSPSLLASCTNILVKWLKDNEKNIISTLQCSAIIISSSTFVTIFNGIFKIRSPKKPNLITTDLKKAETFVKNIMIDYFKKN